MGINILGTEYVTIKQLDNDDKGTVELVRGGARLLVLRTMNGNISSYTALKKIVLPFLPKIEFAEFDGERTIVLEEYIPGGRDIVSLTEEKDIVAAFCELCDVLCALHSRGIVHRDIKPSNILIAPDGHIRLIDFDASRRFDASKDGDTRCLGTKGYAPPEQFGYSQTNAASDIYSLGVTLKTVLGSKAEKRKYKRIIRKCTEFDPQNRFQSAASVKKALSSNGASLILPALILAAVLPFAVYFGERVYDDEADSIPDTAPTETISVQTSAQAETTAAVITTAAVTTSADTASPPATEETTAPTTETTTAPVTETTPALATETTTAPATEVTTALVTESETTVTVPIIAETSVSTVKTTTAASKTKPSSAETTTTSASETTTVPVSSETVSKTTSPTGLPADKIYKKLLTCATDGTKTPAFTRYEFSSGQFCDVLNEPFEFVLDEAVLGTWSELNYTNLGTIIYPRMNYNLSKKSLIDSYPRYVTFNEDGTCFYESYSNFGMNKKLMYSSDLLNWTYGVIESPAVEEYCFYEKYYLYTDESGEEYLFIEHKNGDYMNSRNPEAGMHYYIYERYKGD